MKLVKILPAVCLLLSASFTPALAADIPVTESDGLAAAVEAASDGDVLLLSADTTYTLTNQVVISKAITIRGAGIDSTIVRQTVANKRILILDNENARVEGCTITGANVSKEINHTGKDGDGFQYGIAVTITTNGGTLSKCRVTGNATTSSVNHNRCVGVYSMGSKGTISHCRIDNNKINGGTNNTYGGVRLAGGTLEYCLVTDNKGHQTGGIGVLAACTVKNCVFYANEASDSCGGNLYTETADAVFTDCIFAAGKCPESKSGTGRPEWAGDKAMTFNNCAFPTDVALNSSWKGTPFKCDAQFFDLIDFASRLAPEATADLGWKPYDRTVAGCDFTLSAKKTRQTVAITATAVVNAIDNPSYVWTVTDPDGGQTMLTDAAPAIATPKLGTYTVSLSVSGIAAPSTASFVVVAEKVYPTTAAELMKAVELSVDEEEIILTAQTYEITSALSLKTATTLRGQGRGKTVIRQKTTSQRVVLVDHPQALVEGITLLGTATKSEYAHGVVAYIGDTGGTIRNCDITGGGKSSGNWTHGLGVAMVGDGLIDHCFITNNVRTTTGVNMYGGGVYALKGTLESCLIANNASWNSGGGIYVGGPITVRNCTIANNDILYSSGSGGGIFLAVKDATFFNCIISDNRSGESDSAVGKPDWGGSQAATFTTSVFPTTTKLDQNVVKGATQAVISFVSVKDGDYHMQGSSGTINAGTDDGNLPETDLDGVERVLGGVVDIGCFEADPYTFSASFTGPAKKVGFKGETNVYVATAIGVKEGESVTFNWTVQTSDGRTLTATGEVLELEMSEYGDWTVGMTATSGGKTSEAAPVTYTVVPRVLYVKPPTPEAMAAARAPYDSWDNAATNILDAVALALSGAEVRLSEGEFPVKERIDLMTGVSLVGQGWTKTTVRQTAKTKSILYINHEAAVVRGLTLTGMRAEAEIHSRGAVIIERNGGIVEDCRITGNVYTRPYENQASGVGITINGKKGICRRCIIDRNKGSDGVNNCRGGGVQGYYGLLENCLVCCNTNKCAAGIAVWADFTVRNCTVVGNVATGTDNNYGQQGVGGICNDGANGGTECLIENTVFADNVSLNQSWTTGGYPEWRQSSSAKLTFVNCCLTNGIAWPATATACINGDPLFNDAAADDFTLKVLSPCRNAGSNAHIEAGATDLLGQPRRYGRRVDIGCYELQQGIGLSVLVR